MTIDAQRICRKYGDFLAVDDVSFKIGRGEIVGLLGHNGAGKSTIMKVLTGYLEPSRGQVFIRGEELWASRAAAQSHIGYLPENCPIYPEMTVVDFLDYTASLRGIERSQRSAAIRRAIERAELEVKATALIGTLSRGFRQRVGVAQALLHEPDILILDEPTNGLDPGQIEHMRELIKTLGKQATVIISTHILPEVDAVCDRVLILRHGRLALDSRLADLCGQGLLLSCDARPSLVLERLRGLAGVASATLQREEGGRFIYLIEPQGQQETLAPVLARTVVNAGWQLFALQHEEQSLERVFHQITTGEVNQNAA